MDPPENILMLNDKDSDHIFFDHEVLNSSKSKIETAKTRVTKAAKPAIKPKRVSKPVDKIKKKQYNATHRRNNKSPFLKDIDLMLKDDYKDIDQLKSIIKSLVKQNSSLRKQKQCRDTDSGDHSISRPPTNEIILKLPSSPELKENLKRLHPSCLSPTFDDNNTKQICKLVMANTDIIKHISDTKSTKKNNQQFAKGVHQFVSQMLQTEGGEYSKLQLLNEFKLKYTKDVFNPANTSAQMDSSENSSYNYQSYQKARTTEKGPLNAKLLLPCVQSVKNWNHDFELGIKLDLIDATVTEKMCKLDCRKVINQLIRSCFQLRKHGAISEEKFYENFDTLKTIYFTITLDGAKLTEHKSMLILAIGAKMDELLKAIDCYYLNNEQKCKYQSCKSYTLTGFANTNDDVKNSSRLASETLKSVCELNKTCMLYDEDSKLFYKTAVLICMDLKALETITGMGHASHSGGHFCLFCECLSHERGSRNYFQCEKCISKNRACYCYKIAKGNIVNQYGEENVSQRKTFLMLNFPKSKELKAKNVEAVEKYLRIEDADQYTADNLKTMLSGLKARLDQISVDTIDDINIIEIDYNLWILHHDVDSSNYIEACTEYGIHYSKTASIDDVSKRSRLLLKKLRIEGSFISYCKQFNESGSMIDTLDFVCICLMHCIMRVSEKLITTLLREATKTETRQNKILPAVTKIINLKLSNEGPYQPNMRNTSDEDHNDDPNNVTDTVNISSEGNQFMEILEENRIEEEAEEPSYGFRLKMEEKKLADYKISYVRNNRVLEVMDEIIDACDLEETQANMFKNVFKLWSSIKKQLLNEKQFEPTDIENLESDIHDFKILYLDNFGTNYVTNYIHIIISGHVIEMIERYGNLAIFSGIGFENLVGRVRSFYFKRTNRGGNKGRGKSRCKSKASENLRGYMLRRYARVIGDILKKNPEGDQSFIEKLHYRGNALNLIIRNEYSKRFRLKRKIKLDIIKLNNLITIVKDLKATHGEENDVLIESVLKSKLNTKGSSYLLESLLTKSDIVNPSGQLYHLARKFLSTKNNREEFLKQFCLDLI